MVGDIPAGGQDAQVPGRGLRVVLFGQDVQSVPHPRGRVQDPHQLFRKNLGMDSLVVSSRYGFLVPAGTPRDIIDCLNAVWAKGAAMPDTREKLKSVGVEPLTSTPEQYYEFLKMEIPRWGKVIREANIKSID